mgnify:CR=1 FL=1
MELKEKKLFFKTKTNKLIHNNFFKKMGLQVSYRLPNRITDGYGMKKYFMEYLISVEEQQILILEFGVKLILIA